MCVCVFLRVLHIHYQIALQERYANSFFKNFANPILLK